MKKAILILVSLVIALCAIIALYAVIGSQMVAARAERHWQQTVVQPWTEIGSTSKVEILPLYEEAGNSSRFQIGHGLSYLIRTDAGTILLDVGFSPSATEPLPLLENMKQAKVHPDEIDVLVFSHFHADHTGGVEAWRQGEANLGELADSLVDVQIIAASDFVIRGHEPKIASNPAKLMPGVATTGGIHFVEPFPIFLYQTDGVEQGLVIQLADGGLVLVMGCGHPTVERMVERAEALFSSEVVAVVGGVHSDGLNVEEIHADIQFLKDQGIEVAAISPHDSGPEALAEYQAAFGTGYTAVRVGEPIIIQ